MAKAPAPIRMNIMVAIKDHRPKEEEGGAPTINLHSTFRDRLVVEAEEEAEEEAEDEAEEEGKVGGEEATSAAAGVVVAAAGGV